jgi:hypothetical protein
VRSRVTRPNSDQVRVCHQSQGRQGTWIDIAMPLLGHAYDIIEQTGAFCAA